MYKSTRKRLGGKFGYWIIDKMAKRRSKKQKIGAKHPFLVSWSPSTNEAKESKSVKGQKESSNTGTSKAGIKTKYAVNKAEQSELDRIRHEIKKSLSLASLVLGLELVIYLVWQVNL